MMGWPVVASAQFLDFAQLDVSKDTKTLVLVKAIPGIAKPNPDPLLSAAYTKWQDGWSANIGGVYRWALTTGEHKWSVAPAWAPTGSSARTRTRLPFRRADRPSFRDRRQAEP